MQKYILFIAATFATAIAAQAQVKMGGAPGTPPASAVLEVDGAGNRALLMPRLSVTQIEAIANPVAGLAAYGTNAQALFYFDGAKWRELQEVLTPFSLPHTGVYSVNNNPVLQLTNNGLNGPAIHGISSQSAGIIGFSTDAIGLRGETTNGFGINASSLGGAATYARSESGTSLHIFHNSPTGRALIIDAGRAGIGTNSPAAKLHVSNEDVLFTAPFFSGSATPVPVSGAGRRLMWLQNKAAFRAGQVTGTQWNTDSIGETSIAIGLNPVAKNTGSIAMGIQAAARGEGAIALGENNRADGHFSFASGVNSQATQTNAIAIGNSAIAEGNELLSLALGYQAKSINGGRSLAIGNFATAHFGIAIGDNAIARGIAIGQSTENGASGISIGAQSKTGSSAEATSIGYSCHANGNGSKAIGYQNTANGANSISTGFNAKADGDFSFTLGFNVTAASRGETALGMLNSDYVPAGGASNFNENDRALAIGNGNVLKSNAWVTLKNGKTGLGINIPTVDLHLRHGTSAPGTITNGFKLQNTGANNNRWTLYTVNSNGDLNLYFNDNAAAKGWFSSATGAYEASSAAHLKTDFATLPENTLAQVMLLQPLRYQYKSDPGQKLTIGFIAEDVEPLFPALVERTGEQGEQPGINYAGFSVVAIKAIQELQERVNFLKQKLLALKLLIEENDLNQ
jgi:hypothetical protein